MMLSRFGRWFPDPALVRVAGFAFFEMQKQIFQKQKQNKNCPFIFVNPKGFSFGDFVYAKFRNI